MLVLGFESSCDESGVALVSDGGVGLPRLLGHALFSQIEMHQAYGGVVPELASRDHIRRLLPLTQEVMARAGRRRRPVELHSITCHYMVNPYMVLHGLTCMYSNPITCNYMHVT